VKEGMTDHCVFLYHGLLLRTQRKKEGKRERSAIGSVSFVF